ncbi:MAG TPA: ATP-binding domain-containing protein, partial [Savagea sp.]
GIDALNKRIQEKLNPLNDKKREIVYGDTHYRVGDKVLQLVNQPESNVFNGDIGEVVAIFYAKETTEKKDVVVVAFDAIEVTYEKQDLNQLTLAYCCSIHKAQGSEFPLVIMPLVRSFRNMLQKNLIYTGITRAKQFLILVGEEDIWLEGMHKIGTMQRQTTLKERLTDEVYEDVGDTPLILSEETIMSIDPMIGMENISPYDFM